MTKKTRLVLIAVILLVACAIPLLVHALPLAVYQNNFITERYSENTPTFTKGKSFNGYPGNFSVGYFPAEDPGTFSVFSQYAKKHDILCNRASSDDGDQWTYGGMYLSITSGGQPGRMILTASNATAIAYTVPHSGIVTLSLDRFELHTAASDIATANFAIFKNGEMVWPENGEWKTYASSEPTNFYTPERTTVPGVSVKAGDVLTFALHRQNNATQYAHLEPAVTYTQYSGEVFAQKDCFSTAQNGIGSWYAYYGIAGKETAYPLEPSGEVFGGVAGAGTVGAGQLTVGDTYETVLIFRSPIIATYTLSADSFLSDRAVSLDAYIFRANDADPVAPEDLDDNGLDMDIVLRPEHLRTEKETLFLDRTAGTFTDVTDIYLDRGDLLVLRFAPVSGGATVTFTPKMSATSTVHDTSKNKETLTQLPSGEALRPDVRLTATSIALSGRINMYFYVYFDPNTVREADEYGLLYFDADETEFTYENGKKLPRVSNDGDTYIYMFSDINAKEMSDSFYVCAFAKEDGELLYDSVELCSVRSTAMQYYEAYRGSQSTSGQALYSLVCRMLNYGAIAQTAFGYNTANLANAGLTAEETQINGERVYKNDQKFLGSATLDGVGFYGISLLLEDLPRFRVFVTLPDGADADALTLQMSTDANFEKILESYSLGDCPVYSGTTRRALTNGIAPAALGTVYYFRVTDGTNTSKTLAYSVESYTARAEEQGQPIAERHTLYAMFDYADAANAYLLAANQSVTGIAIGSQELVELIRLGRITPGATYTVSDTLPLRFGAWDAGATYDLKGITVISEGGISLALTDNVTLKNFTLDFKNSRKVAISLKTAEDITLENLTVTGFADTGIAISGTVDTMMLRNVTVDGARVGIRTEAGAREIYLVSLDVTATTGEALIDAAGSYITDCDLTTAGETAVLLTDDAAELRESRLQATENGVTVSGATNVLVSENILADCGILIRNSDNVSVVFNKANVLNGYSNRHFYVIENTLDTLSLTDNNYLIANRNSGAVTATGNCNQNGDNVTDMTERPAAGVNEDLLPHVDKDAFIGTERRLTVRTAEGVELALDSYISAQAADHKRIIIAPGAYSCNSSISISNVSDYEVYAYGVLYEAQDFKKVNFSLKSCTRVSIYGMTLDMVLNGCGHMIAVKKEDGKIYFRAAAGMYQDMTDPEYFSEEGGNGISFMGYRKGVDYPYADVGLGALTYDANTGLLMANPSGAIFHMVKVGDMMTCRANGENVAVIRNGETNKFEDVTVLSGSIRCFWDEACEDGTVLNRVMVSPAPAKVIDRATYEEYCALEEEYGVDFGVYFDGTYYRGTPARTVTADSTHTSNSRTGMKATSCIFEGLSDDATNHQGFFGRLSDYDPETGIITYKSAIATLGYTNICYDFAVGDLVNVYTFDGKFVCSTPALSSTEKVGQETATNSKGEERDIYIRKVKVDPAAFKHANIEGYDLTTSNAYAQRVMIDNGSRNGDGMVYDNVLARNIRSRGFLIKSADNVVRNCSFYNIGMAAIGLIYEPEWGESGVATRNTIINNYIENTGYFNNIPLYAPITVVGLGLDAGDEYLPYEDLVISGNVIRKRATDNALYINSANGVTVENNDFGTKADETEAKAYPSVYVNFAKEIVFNGNTYSPYCTTVESRFLFIGHRNITGTDVGGSVADDPATSSTAYTTAYIKNLPEVVGTEGDVSTLSYEGLAWEMGRLTPADYVWTRYNTLCSPGWYQVDSGKLWSSSGGIYATNGYRFAALSNANSAIRYNAEYNGTVTLRINSFTPPFGSGDGSADGYFAIFINGTMVWPKQGGSYTSGSDWFHITKDTAYADIASSLGALEFTVQKGDTIDFVSKVTDSGKWSAFAAFPAVTYIKTEE